MVDVTTTAVATQSDWIRTLLTPMRAPLHLRAHGVHLEVAGPVDTGVTVRVEGVALDHDVRRLRRRHGDGGWGVGPDPPIYPDRVRLVWVTGPPAPESTPG